MYPHFFAGVAGVAVRLPLMTEERGRAWAMASAIDVMTNSAKKMAVSLCSSVVAPRAPNAVCDPPPPKRSRLIRPFYDRRIAER